MKKLILTFLVTICIFSIVSCDSKIYYPNHNNERNDNESVSAEEKWCSIPFNVSEKAKPVETYPYKFVETKNTFVFVDNRDYALMQYLLKSTGDVRALCTDPLCRHTEKEMCSAICDRTTASALCYAEDTGELFYVRRNDPNASATERYSLIVSVNIDQMDLSQKIHHKLPKGSEITEMCYENGFLYFSQCVLDDETEKLLIQSLNVQNGNVKEIVSLPYVDTAFTVHNSVLYYYCNGEMLLNAYDLDRGEHKTVYNTGNISNYSILNNAFIYQTADSVCRVELESGTETVIYKAEQPFTHIDFGFAAQESRIWYYGYTPKNIDTYQGNKTNGSGGKIYIWEEDHSALFFEFDADIFINNITPHGTGILVETYRYNEEFEKRAYDYYALIENESEIVCVKLGMGDVGA